jgi:hexosaminidase
MQINSNNQISIIPQPVKLNLRQGSFQLKNNTIIFTDPNLVKIAEFLKNLTGLDLKIKDLNMKNFDDNTITLRLIKEEKVLRSEGYILEIFPNKIEILASTPQGMFYGIQTIRQLFPAEIELSPKEILELSIPCVSIEDYPRFSWRGFMLDESRHFFGKETVIKILDIMASLKFNTFHWHLTDDQGWRIEIKKYPRLIEIGSKRKGTITTRKKLDGIPVSGYYIQEELKEIIDYASKRFIKIIPEVDVPGHVTAVLASYPELSCTGGPFEVSTHFGIHKEVLCVGKEKVFEFVQNVLNEVMKIFPSEVIHTGGDEVPKRRWQKCSDCQTRIKREGLKSEEELQVYFTNRIANYLKSKERRLMGWNEILNEKLTSNAICHYWFENFDRVIEHIKKGRNVVMSEMRAVYLNYPYKEIPLNKTYKYDPIPDDLDKSFHKQILGIEACLWAEYVKDSKRLEWQIFPRLIAIAETGWTSKENKNFNSFIFRLDSYLKRLSFQKINYAPKDEFMV